MACAVWRGRSMRSYLAGIRYDAWSLVLRVMFRSSKPIDDGLFRPAAACHPG